MSKKKAVEPMWVAVGKPFSELAAIPGVLRGLEIEMEGGQVYIVGDINPDGGHQGGPTPFSRRDTIVRARRVF